MEILQLPVTCGIHTNHPFTFYCSGHDEVFCDNCREIHEQCANVKEIDQILQEFNSQKHFLNESDEWLNDLNIRLGKKDKEKKSLEEERDKILLEIRTFRNEINSKLNGLENCLTQELSDKIESTVSEVEKLFRIIVM